MSTSKHKQMNIFIYVHICKQEIHLLLRNEKKQGKEKKSVKYKTFPGRCGFWGGRAGVELRIWLKQGEEKSLLARILKILEETRKRLSRQKSTKKCVNSSKESVVRQKKFVNSPEKCRNVRKIWRKM